MVFSCTKKVLDKVKKFKTIEKEKEETGLYNWYVDIINLERKNYFLFTNSKTLFSFFIYAGTQKELKNIEALFENKLKELVIREIGSSSKYVENIFPKNKDYKFTKTNSRSVLGSMNDLKFHIKAHIQHDGELKYTYDLINHRINEIPMGALKYSEPVELMKIELEKIIKNKT